MWNTVGTTDKDNWRFGRDEVISAGLRGEVFFLCSGVLTTARRAPAVDAAAAKSIFIITQELARVGEPAALPAAVTEPAPGVCDR